MFLFFKQEENEVEHDSRLTHGESAAATMMCFESQPLSPYPMRVTRCEYFEKRLAHPWPPLRPPWPALRPPWPASCPTGKQDLSDKSEDTFIELEKRSNCTRAAKNPFANPNEFWNMPLRRKSLITLCGRDLRHLPLALRSRGRRITEAEPIETEGGDLENRLPF